MRSFNISAETKKAIKIGFLCSFAYFCVYIVRNLLSVVAPEMTETGLYTVEYIGTISTAYMMAYAIGQLINGIIGDKIKSAVIYVYRKCFFLLYAVCY